jgi:hypothetical protein
MAARIIGWVILCFALTAGWWFGVDWAQRNYDVMALAAQYVGNSASDVVHYGPPAVLNLLMAAAMGLFGRGTSPLGKMGVMLWSGALPYLAFVSLITVACNISTTTGNQGECIKTDASTMTLERH